MARLTGTTPPPARLAGVVAALALAAAALFSPAVARAEGAVDTWDGTADTSWYDASDPRTEYTITTAEQLAGLSKLTRTPVTTPSGIPLDGETFDGIIITLGADLDLDNLPWVATGDFEGTFDGAGHTISNLSVSDLDWQDDNDKRYLAGLFGSLFGATVKNLTITNATVELGTEPEMAQAGILASSSTGQNRYGDVGTRPTVIQNCHVSGKISSMTNDPIFGGASIGGLVGQTNGSLQISGCSAWVDIVVDQSAAAPTVGGLVGTWQDVNDSSLVRDSYYSGSMTAPQDDALVSGIVGLSYKNASVSSDAPDTMVINCLSVPELNLGSKNGFLGIGALWKTDANPAANCLWPSNATGGVALSSLSGSSVNLDIPQDQDVYGRGVDDFSDLALIEELNANSAQGVVWAMGVCGHPVFATQTGLVAADYSAVDDALAQIPADLSGYTAESAAAVEAARGAVDRTLTADRQDEVDAMADAIEAAVAALERLADYGAVDAALAKAEALDRSLYTERTLADLDAAVAAVERGYGETRQAEVDAMADAIEAALAALEEAPASEPTPTPQPEPEPGQDAGDKGALPATGDPAALLAPALALVGGGAALLARRRVA